MKSIKVIIYCFSLSLGVTLGLKGLNTFTNDLFIPPMSPLPLPKHISTLSLLTSSFILFLSLGYLSLVLPEAAIYLINGIYIGGNLACLKSLSSILVLNSNSRDLEPSLNIFISIFSLGVALLADSLGEELNMKWGLKRSMAWDLTLLFFLFLTPTLTIYSIETSGFQIRDLVILNSSTASSPLFTIFIPPLLAIIKHLYFSIKRRVKLKVKIDRSMAEERRRRAYRELSKAFEDLFLDAALKGSGDNCVERGRLVFKGKERG